MKALKLLPIFLLVFYHQVLAQSWTTLAPPATGRYDDLFFLNDSTAWACNAKGLAYKTSDAGQTWTPYTVSSMDYLRSIEFMDADTGFCGGLDDGSFLFRSKDGGLTWANISAEVPGLESGVCGLSYPGNKVMYGCGVFHGPAYVIKSTNGGLTWENIDMSPYASGLVDIHFISPDTGWVSGKAVQNSGGVILRTTDGGASWQQVAHTGIQGDYVWKMQRLDAQNWFASIERDNIAGAKTHILKSTDGGITWQTVLVKNGYNRLQAIGFVTPLHGWTGDFNLFETLDGGQTWQNINNVSIYGRAFNRFWRINEKKAFLSGERVYRFDDLSTSSSEPAQAEVSDGEFHGLSVSPNPNNGNFQISITLRQKTQVILKIYSYNGGFEELLWTGEQAEGDYLLQADLAQQPAGTYVVYLKTNHGTQTRMVTLLR